jgi:hypothetical protein
MEGDMGSPIFDATFGTGRFMHEEPMKSPKPQDVREAFMQVLASLVAAVSLLKGGGKAAKKAAPSDKMFDQMILDYERAIEQGRTALAQSDAERSLIKGERGGISWGGSFYVEGNKESVDAVRAAHDAQERCKYLDKMISEKQLVRPAQSDARICLSCDLSGECHSFDNPKQVCVLCEHHEPLTVEAVNRAFKAYENRKAQSDAESHALELEATAERQRREEAEATIRGIAWSLQFEPTSDAKDLAREYLSRYPYPVQ